LRLDLRLQRALALHRIEVVAHGCLEDIALILLVLPDRFNLSQPQKPREVVGILHIVLVGVVANECVNSRIANHQFRHVGLEQLADPAAHAAFFQHQMLLVGRYRFEPCNQFLFGGVKLPMPDSFALIIELAKHAVFGVRIKAQPSYTLLHKRTPGV
jgi:hypothetical protein